MSTPSSTSIQTGSVQTLFSSSSSTLLPGTVTDRCLSPSDKGPEVHRPIPCSPLSLETLSAIRQWVTSSDKCRLGSHPSTHFPPLGSLSTRVKGWRDRLRLPPPSARWSLSSATLLGNFTSSVGEIYSHALYVLASHPSLSHHRKYGQNRPSEYRMTSNLQEGWVWSSQSIMSWQNHLHSTLHLEVAEPLNEDVPIMLCRTMVHVLTGIHHQSHLNEG